MREDQPGGKPTIDVRPRELQVVEGESAQFTCTSPGTAPGFTVTWRRVGRMMPSTVRVSDGVLYFPTTREDYAGQYYCIIGNQYGYEQDIVTLAILGMKLSFFFVTLYICGKYLKMAYKRHLSKA